MKLTYFFLFYVAQEVIYICVCVCFSCLSNFIPKTLDCGVIDDMLTMHDVINFKKIQAITVAVPRGNLMVMLSTCCRRQ